MEVDMATGFGVAGKGPSEMAKARYAKFSVILGIFLLAGILLFLGSVKLAKLGLPVVLMVIFFIKIGADHLEREANRLKKRAKQAEKGAAAEERVSKKLTSLPEEYRYFNGIDFDSFDIDHVVVGPGGVFLVETKSHGGRITAVGDELLLNGARPTKNFLNQTWRQTRNLEGFLYRLTSKKWKIIPVLCFTNAFVGIRRPVKGIDVVSIGFLSKYLLRQPESLSAEEIEHLSMVLSSWLTRHGRRLGSN
jgi:hypothetical protein